MGKDREKMKGIEIWGRDWENCAKEADFALLPLASFEYHGPMAPVGTDAALAMAFAEYAQARYRCVAYPPVFYTACPNKTKGAPTVSIDPPVMLSYLTNVLEGIYASGFSRVLILNAHDGNMGIGRAAAEAVHGDAHTLLVNWWELLTQEETERFFAGGGRGHGGPYELSCAWAALGQQAVGDAAYDLPSRKLAGRNRACGKQAAKLSQVRGPYLGGLHANGAGDTQTGVCSARSGSSDMAGLYGRRRQRAMSNYETLREETLRQDGAQFPAKSFTALVLKPAYDNAREHLLGAMMEVNRAQLIMLTEQGLLTREEAKAIRRGLETLDTESLASGEYTGRYEDLFFEVEARLLELCGDPAGSLHLARSRNDMGVTMYRMVLRRCLAGVMDELCAFTGKLTAVAEKHRDTIMVAITHTQQAQVSTIGHYLLGACQVLERDFDRLRHAYETVNHSAMGACAITTTGFPISRGRMAELLGFDGYILNSYDAIGGGDYLGEAATALLLCAIDAGRIIQDLMLWASQEFGVLRAADPYVQVSSIMPQKRNPVSIEHLRSLLSSVSGQCQTLLQMLHNTPYGDIVDTEDDAQPFLWRACDTLAKCYALWGNVMTTVTLNKDVMLERARNGFAVITELADTLVRETPVSFRKAHSVATLVARTLSQQGRPLTSLREDELAAFFEQVTGSRLEVPFEKLRACLVPEHFVEIRNIPGGCGPQAMTDMLARQAARGESDLGWLAARHADEEKARRLQAEGLERI